MTKALLGGWLIDLWPRRHWQSKAAKELSQCRAIITGRTNTGRVAKPGKLSTTVGLETAIPGSRIPGSRSFSPIPNPGIGSVSIPGFRNYKN